MSITALIFIPIQLLLAGHSAKNESCAGKSAAAILMLISLSFIGGVVHVEYELLNPTFGLGIMSVVGIVSRICVYAGIVAALSLATIGMSFMVSRNFGKGLKAHPMQSQFSASYDTITVWRDGGRETQQCGYRPASVRMEID